MRAFNWLVLAVVLLPGVTVGDEGESLREVTGFAVKVDQIDQDGTEMA